MTEKIQSGKVICRGGLNTNQNYLDLSDNSPGSATTLTNFEPSLYGGYRRINGFEPLEESLGNSEVDSTNATGKILCVAIHNDDIIVARAQTTGGVYRFYKWVPGGAWVAYTTGLTLTSLGVEKIRWATYNFDGIESIIFADGINNATIYNGTTWTRVNPAGTGVDFANAGGNQALAKPKYVDVFRNHIFLSGDSSNKHVICHSAPNTDYDWLVASGAGQIIAGFDVIQLQPFRDANFIFGEIKIKKIVVSGADFTLQDVTSNVGCVASDSVLEIAGDLIFLSQDGIRTIAATERIGDVELGSITQNIQQDITELSRVTSSLNINALVVRKKSQFRMFFSDSSKEPPDNVGILGGLKTSGEGIRWEWSKIVGIRTSCATSGYINGVEYVIHGDHDGLVYRQESGNNFNGNNIQASYTTPYIDFGESQVRKTMRTINLFVRAESAVTISTHVAYDWDSLDVENPAVYDLSSEGGDGSIYGEAVYDVSRYGGATAPVMVTNIEGSGRSVRITFGTYGTSAPYTIQGIVFEFSVNGRI